MFSEEYMALNFLLVFLSNLGASWSLQMDIVTCTGFTRDENNEF
jgi:hypothetical protein